jgi:hypothetical protein
MATTGKPTCRPNRVDPPTQKYDVKYTRENGQKTPPKR